MLSQAVPAKEVTFSFQGQEVAFCMTDADLVRACTIGNCAVASRGSSCLSPRRKSKEPLSRRISISELLYTKYILSAMLTSATARNTTDSAAELQIAPFQTLKVVPSGRKQSVWTPFAFPSFILHN